MKCITVYPILKHTFSEILTYWTSHSVSSGDVIRIPFRNTHIWAVVDTVLSIYEAKEFIKSQSYTIKKITEHTQTFVFSHAFMLSCLHTSRYYVLPFGEVFSEMVPKQILFDLETEVKDNPKKHFRDISVSKDFVQPVYVQDTYANRISHICTYIQNKTSCIIAPTTDQVEKIAASLKEKGYTDVRSLYGSSTKSALHTSKKPITSQTVFVSTPIYTYLLDAYPIEICVLEYAGSEQYRHMKKKFDFRYAIREYCRRSNLLLIESDALLPIYEDVKKFDIDVCALPKKPDIHIVDMAVSGKAKVKKKHVQKKEIPEDESDLEDMLQTLDEDIVTHKKLNLISPELFALIRHAEKKQTSIVLYTVRKGLSSSVVCKDCAHTLTCSICQLPYQLATVEGKPLYICPKQHDPISVDIVCPVCGGIHLTPLGSGTQAIADELRHVSSMPIQIIDSDRTTKSQAQKIYTYNTTHTVPTIYIGTELMLNQIQRTPCMYSAIVSLETILALPGHLSEYMAIQTIQKLLESTLDTVLIQTRNSTHDIWKSLKEGSWKNMQDRLKEESFELQLPPYTTHIQIRIPTSKQKEILRVQEYIQEYAKRVYVHLSPAFSVLHVYVERKAWPNIQMLSYLKSLPAYIQIEVDSPGLV